MIVFVLLIIAAVIFGLAFLGDVVGFPQASRGIVLAWCLLTVALALWHGGK